MRVCEITRGPNKCVLKVGTVLIGAHAAYVCVGNNGMMVVGTALSDDVMEIVDCTSETLRFSDSEDRIGGW